MLNKQHWFFAAVIVALLTLLSGCATNSQNQATTPTIERVDSSTVTITHAYIDNTKEGGVLKGEIKRTIHSHGGIPGHVRIEIVNSEGKVVKAADIPYTPKPNSEHIADFSVLLPDDYAENSIVRVIHHDMKTHITHPSTSPWQDVGTDK